MSVAANNLEIEFRYLLPALPDFGDLKPSKIVQGYLFRSFERTVRYRVEISPDGTAQAYETIKGPKTGASGEEIEKIIAIDDAIGKLVECGAENMLFKDRYKIAAENGLTWEVDSFKNKLSGLVIAELEVPSEDTAYTIPAWLQGVDITPDRRFANAKMVDLDRAELIAQIRSVLEPAGFTTDLTL